MKISRSEQPKKFTPVVITLESEEELKALARIAYTDASSIGKMLEAEAEEYHFFSYSDEEKESSTELIKAIWREISEMVEGNICKDWR